MRKPHSFLLLLVLGFTSLLIAQQQVPPVRVYVEAIHGHRIVPGVDHSIAVPDDPAAHNQQMERQNIPPALSRCCSYHEQGKSRLRCDPELDTENSLFSWRQDNT